MKVIGRSNEGGYIVEFQKPEFEELSRLCLAAEGKPPDLIYMGPPEDFARNSTLDLGTVFSAVKAFYTTKFNINELEHLVESLNESVNAHWGRLEAESELMITGDGAPPPEYGTFTSVEEEEDDADS